jgi:hypothetical protein
LNWQIKKLKKLIKPKQAARPHPVSCPSSGGDGGDDFFKVITPIGFKNSVVCGYDEN